MDKIILNDNTNLDFSESAGLSFIKITNKTFEELVILLTTENLAKVQIANSNDEVYGNYTNLKGISVSKMLSDGSIVINLEETVSAQ